MSVLSSNTTVTTERPYFEIERTSSTFGIPDIARSTATVTYCSTSTGESAGAAVITWTWTFVTSGTASIGRSSAARMPRTTKSAVDMSTTARWRRDQAMMRAKSGTSLLLAEGALHDRALEREDAVDDDPLALAQPAQHLDPPGGAAAEGHGMDLEVSVRLQNEHDV